MTLRATADLLTLVLTTKPQRVMAVAPGIARTVRKRPRSQRARRCTVWWSRWLRIRRRRGSMGGYVSRWRPLLRRLLITRRPLGLAWRLRQP